MSRGCSPAFPGTDVTLVDVDETRADVAARSGSISRSRPGAGERDLVVHTSATSAGLQRCLDLLATKERCSISAGTATGRSRSRSAGRSTRAGSGIRASQVGRVAPARRATRSTADRLALALDLLRDPAFDALVTGSSPFAELPDVMARLAAGTLSALCHTISYGEE